LLLLACTAVIRVPLLFHSISSGATSATYRCHARDSSSSSSDIAVYARLLAGAGKRQLDVVCCNSAPVRCCHDFMHQFPLLV
jgi:hypothetical protein